MPTHMLYTSAILVVCSWGQLLADDAITWELTKPWSAKDLNEGRLLEFRGAATAAMGSPKHTDFRLEQVSPEKRWVPIMFGARDRSEVIPPDGTVRNVRLLLQSATAEREHAALADRRKEMLMFATAKLRSGAEYQLSWTCRLGDKSAPVTKKLKFRVAGEDTQELPPPAHYYLAEIIYRTRDAEGVLFLGQKELPSQSRHRFGIQAVGFDADGKYVSPPNPGYVRLLRSRAKVVTSKGWKVRAPLADMTRYYGVQLAKLPSGQTRLDVSVSDQGTGAEQPRKPGKPTFTLYKDALFRIELLTSNVQRLRDDRDYWKRRTREIAAEVKGDDTLDERIRTWVERNVR